MRPQPGLTLTLEDASEIARREILTISRPSGTRDHPHSSRFDLHTPQTHTRPVARAWDSAGCSRRATAQYRRFCVEVPRNPPAIAAPGDLQRGACHRRLPSGAPTAPRPTLRPGCHGLPTEQTAGFEDPPRVLPVDVTDEGRQDAVAEQFLHPLGQRGDHVGRDGERHVLDLPHPRLAVLRRESEPNAIAAVRSTAM